MSSHFLPNPGGDPTRPPHRFAAIPGNGNYRSGHIVSYEQVKLLRDQYGIRTIVNLAADAIWRQEDPRFNCGIPPEDRTDFGACHSGNPRCEVACEPLWAADLGMNYIFVPLGGRPPKPAQWAEIKQALVNGHTLIHCVAGSDRTGAVVARWKRAVEGTFDAEIMEYTKSFGGAWTSATDSNRRLREWLLAGSYEPETAAAMEAAPGIQLRQEQTAWLGIGLLWIAGGGLLWWSLRQRRVG